MLRIVFLLLFVSPLSVFSDVAGFLTGKFKDLSELAGKVWGAIKHTLTFVTGIFRNVGAAWSDLHFAFRTLISGIEHVAEGTYSAIRWLAGTAVPKWTRAAIKDAIDWATRNIKSVANRAIKLVGQAKEWALGKVNAVLAFARAGLSNLRKLINTASHWIKDVGHRLWDIVFHPAKLVTWILPSLVTPLFRWIFDHLEAVSTLILRWGFSNIGKIAPVLERAITKVL